MNRKILFLGLFAILTPGLMLAADPKGDVVNGALDTVGGWLNKIAMLIIGLTVIAIFWGAFVFIFNFKDKKDEGKEVLMWGIIALFIMVSLWGIVGVLKKATVGDNNDAELKGNLAIPTIQKATN